MEISKEANLMKNEISKNKALESEVKNFINADEVRKFPQGKLELLKFGDKTIGKATFAPGWKWSTSLKEIVHTASCEAPHFQYHISGILKVRMDNGEEFELHPGDVSMIASGHDAWVVGDEPVVVVDFQGMGNYAKKDIVH